MDWADYMDKVAWMVVIDAEKKARRRYALLREREEDVPEYDEFLRLFFQRIQDKAGFFTQEGEKK